MHAQARPSAKNLSLALRAWACTAALLAAGASHADEGTGDAPTEPISAASPRPVLTPPPASQLVSLKVPAPDDPALRKTLRAARRQGPIVLDGVPDEPAWQAAEAAEGFTQYTPDEGQPAAVRTSARILWDAEYLYVGATCEDPEPSEDRISRRDRWVDGDWFAVLLDTTLDKRTAYRFQVFSGGHQLDGLHYDDNNLTTDWDTAWESQVAHTATGWSVEMKIPLRALRIPEGVQEFGFNFVRHLVRRNEDDQFRFRPRAAAGTVSQLGTLVGLEGMQPVRSLELRPYIGGRLSSDDPSPGPVAAPFSGGPCAAQGVSAQVLAAGCVGLDLKYSLASDLSLVATFNPDFGQVEADSLVLNLTTFESFFPEKRPFFLEGLDLFNTPVGGGGGGPYGGSSYQLFYSRRIGRPPPPPDFTYTPNAVTLYEPSARPVAAAVKLTGKVGAASLGVLASLEQPVDALVYNPLPDPSAGVGQTSSQRVADAVGSAALRLRAPFGDHLIGGVMATSVDPLFSPGGRHAHVASADFTLFKSDRSLALSGMVTGSLVNGGGREILRDGTVFDPGSAASGGGESGGAGVLTLDYTGEYTGGFLSVDWLSPTFTTNSLGYMRRANLARAFGVFNLRQPHPTELTQRIQLAFFGKEVRDSRLDYTLYRNFGVEQFTAWGNNWFTTLDAWLEGKGVDDRELSDGTRLERPAGGLLAFYGSTDQRKAVHLEVNAVRTWTSRPSQFTWELASTIGFRPHPRFEGGLDLDYAVDRGAIRSLQQAATLAGPGAPPVLLDPAPAVMQERVYLLAPLSARSFSATLRGTFAFSPTLTLQAYAQLFVAGEAYGDALRYVAQPGKPTIALDALAPAQGGDAAPNNDYRSAGLNVNLILRWEWRLGSTFYLVYAHRTSNGFTPPARGLDFGGELAALSRGNGAALGDTLLVKIDLLAAL